jgi:hypothetical protein
MMMTTTTKKNGNMEQNITTTMASWMTSWPAAEVMSFCESLEAQLDPTHLVSETLGHWG